MNPRKIKTRRPKHTQDELREFILAAATSLIEEGGLEALSAREVARRIGYSPGTLYNVFKDRDEIILMIESQLLDDLAAHLDAVDSQDNAREHVIALANAYLEFTHAHANLWNLLFEHRLSDGQVSPTWYQEKIDGLMDKLEAAVAPLTAGRHRVGGQLSARVLWAGVHGITSLSAAGKLTSFTNEAAQKLVQNLVATYLDGLASEKTTSAQPAARKPSRQRT